MARIAKKVECSEDVLEKLKRIVSSHTAEVRLVRRAKIVLGCIEEKRLIDISEELHEQVDVIIKWRNRFIAKGIAGLHDAPRSGKPIKYDAEWEKTVMQKLESPPPNGQASWDGPSLAATLNTSEDAVQRFLQKKGIQLKRLRTWCVSTDPEFVSKATDIVGLYLNPPENAIVISVDEKPSIQALSRTVGFVRLNNGKEVRAMKSTYERNGTCNLFAALSVATGKVNGKVTKTKTRRDFLEFMDDLLKDLQRPDVEEGQKPDVEEKKSDTKEYHVILDNLSTHKNCTEWLEAHPDVTFHFTPTGASWLNQVEIWFNIMTRKVLRGASFGGTESLTDALMCYIKGYNESSKPFEWKKRDVRGSQIRDTLSNLRG